MIITGKDQPSSRFPNRRIFREIDLPVTKNAHLSEIRDVQ